MDPKILTEAAWKATALKFKVKDNGLQRALAGYQNLDDDEYDDLLKAIASVSQLAGALKKVKEVAAVPAVVKYLGDVLSAADSEQGEINKAKLLAKKTEAMTQKKADAEAKNRGQEDEAAEEEEEEEQEYSAKLLAAFQKLKTAKDLSFQFLVCDAKPFCGVIVAKRITPKHKPQLTELTGGSKRFLKVGTCHFEGGKFSFTMEEPVVGLARKLQASIKQFTGKKLPIRVGTESADADEEPAPGGAAASALAATPEIPSAPATAQEIAVLEDRRRAFKQARAAWVAVKTQAEMDVEKVKDGAKTMYLADAAQFPKIAQGCKDIDTILDNLDDELRDTLDQYASTPLKNQARLHGLGAKAIEILDRYHTYVESNPILKAIDLKEFADVTVHAPIMKALGDLRKALT